MADTTAQILIGLDMDARNFGAKARRATRGLDQLDRAGKRASVTFTGLGSTLARTAGILGAGFLGVQGIRAGVSAIAGLESALSGVRAVTGATDQEMARLTTTARELGASTVFSAEEAAQGMRFLGQAGFETNDIIAAIPAALDLAAAGSLDLARAADIASNVLSGFGISAAETERAVDVLAKTAASANTSVEQMGEAMSTVAPVAAALGLSIEDTAAAIGVLSDAGIQASSAGTGLRRVLSGLTNPTAGARAALEGMGLTMRQVSPEANSFVDIIATLADAGLGASEALEIFGDRGGPAILALTGQVPRLRELTGVLEEAEGAAAKMAETLSDNLEGDVRELGSAMAELAQQIGEAGVTSAMRGLTQAVTALARAADESVENWAAFFNIDAEGELRSIQQELDSLARRRDKILENIPRSPWPDQLRDALQEVNAEMLDLVKQRDDLIANRVGAGGEGSGAVAGVAGIGEAASEAAAELREAGNELKNVEALMRELSDLRMEINTVARPDSELNTLDVADAVFGGREALRKGDAEAAVEAADKAREIISRIAKEGTQSRIVIDGMIGTVERLGQEIQKSLSSEDLTAGLEKADNKIATINGRDVLVTLEVDDTQIDAASAKIDALQKKASGALAIGGAPPPGISRGSGETAQGGYGLLLPLIDAADAVGGR